MITKIKSFLLNRTTCIAITSILLQLIIAYIPQYLPNSIYVKLVENMLNKVFLEQSFLFWPEKLITLICFVGQLLCAGLGILCICLWGNKAELKNSESQKHTNFFNKYNAIIISVAIIAITVLSAWYANIFFFTKPLVPNSWYGYPEKYLLKQKISSERVIVDSHFLHEKYNLAGVSVYSPERDLGKNPLSPSSRKAALPEKKIQNYLDKQNEKYLKDFFLAKTSCSTKYIKQLPIKLLPFCDYQNQCVSGLIDKENVSVKINKAAKDNLDITSLLIPDNYFNLEHNWNFYKHTDRFIFHHHNFLLGSANELNLGRPTKEVNIQYGYGHTIAIQKILSFLNSFDFSSYLKLLYSTYFVYFFTSLIIFYVITRNLKLTTLLGLLFFCTLNHAGWPATIIAPGLTPSKHIFDILSIFILWYGLKDNKQQLVKLPLFFLLLLINLWYDFSFGFLLAFSYIISFSILVIIQKKKNLPRNLSYIFICCLFIILVKLLFPVKNTIAEYMFLGIVGLPISSFNAFYILAILSCFLFLIIWYSKNLPENILATLLTLGLYSCGLLSYYIFSSDLYHLLTILPVIMFFVIATLHFTIFSMGNLPRNFFTYAQTLTMVYITYIVIISFNHQIFSYNKYTDIVNQYVMEEWKNPKLQIASNAEEKIFQQAIDLISKYTPNTKKDIAIFSRYDNIIPFAAGKYSNLPIQDLQWLLMSPKEYNQITTYFKTEKPKYLFVDTDIERNFEYDRPFIQSPHLIIVEHLFRVGRLKLMQKLWNEIKCKYKLQEKTPLLSVYELIQ